MFPKTTRILIVEDMPPMRQVLKNILLGMGYQNLLECDNGSDAFDLLITQQKAQTPVELVLSDWNMPYMSGLELLKKVRETNELKKLPFIMVTTEGERRFIIEAIKAGVDSYVVKPFSEVAIQSKLEEVWKKLNPTS